ncbi:MAG: oligosaccharide flippase family protein [Lentisphaeria bacterium]|nr:oligosaccharide flippase family protein [Lentisphaeria bacterium]
MKIPFFKNTVTNYFSMFVRLVQGILVTRWLISHLGEAQYGLWVMLWSFFSYALLLDLRFGVAAQKVTATELFKKDIEKYNHTISSIFFSHVGMALLILPLTFIGSFYVRELFHLPLDATPEYVSFCRGALLLSGLAAAVVFPLGVFPEILAGLQKLYLRNYIIIISKLVELAGVILIFALEQGLFKLLFFVMLVMGLTQMAMFISVKKSLPGFRIRFAFDKEIFKGIFRFSSAVYIISIGRMIWERGMFLLISIFCGLAPVGIFQLGSRIPFLIQQIAQPYVENISPISALLHSRNRTMHLAQILMRSIRWVNFFAAGATIMVMIYAPRIILLLFNVENDEAAFICRLMVLFVYFLLVCRAIPEKFLTMAEEHKFLAKVQSCESAFFIIISLVGLLIKPHELVVVGAMILTKGVGTLFFVIPHLIRRSHIRFRNFVLYSLFEPALLAVATGMVCYWQYYLLRGTLHEFFLLALAGISGVLIYFPALYFMMFDHAEKIRAKKIISKLSGKVRRA